MLNLNFCRCPFSKSWDNLLKNERKTLNFRGWFMHRMFLMTLTVKNAFQKSPGKIQDWIDAKQIQSLNNFVINQRLQQTSYVWGSLSQRSGEWIMGCCNLWPQVLFRRMLIYISDLSKGPVHIHSTKICLALFHVDNTTRNHRQTALSLSLFNSSV